VFFGLLWFRIDFLGGRGIDFGKDSAIVFRFEWYLSPLSSLSSPLFYPLSSPVPSASGRFLLITLDLPRPTPLQHNPPRHPRSLNPSPPPASPRTPRLPAKHVRQRVFIPPATFGEVSSRLLGGVCFSADVSREEVSYRDHRRRDLSREGERRLRALYMSQTVPGPRYKFFGSIGGTDCGSHQLTI
jgi:hypothetical protein